MNLIRFDPVRELEDMTTRLNRFFVQGPLAKTNGDDRPLFADWAPAMDVQETDKEYLIKTDLPEVKKEDVKVNVENGVLTVEGERRQEKEEKGKKFHRVERSYGTFLRRLALPAGVDDGHVTADFKDGVLNVHLPKAPGVTPRSIEVTVG